MASASAPTSTVLSLLTFAALSAAALPPERAAAQFAVTERRFRELPVDARWRTGPLFWLHGDESKERLQEFLKAVVDGGNGAFTAESRPHVDWLGEGWFRDLGICLDAARRNGLKMWIFDEKWWPSGEVAGKVPQKYGAKLLQGYAVEVLGPRRVDLRDLNASNLIAIVAGRLTADGVDGRTLVDLTPLAAKNPSAWSAPPGRWQIMRFTWTYAPGRPLVDGASRDAVDWYIRTVYQPHYDRFRADFGKTIAGFFYDEPETPGDWGGEVMKVLAERGVDWKRALTAWKFKLAGEQQTAARYQYQDAFAEAWGRTLYGGLTKWCRAHGVVSMGHFLEHANEYLAPQLCAGNMMQLQKYSGMGAIDAVFDQFVWGKRVARDAPCWQTPKLGSSVTHAYGKPDDVAMVEIFGARGQDLTYPEMKWWADHMQVSGINFLIPHSFNPRAPHDTDCPPYFYMGDAEPRFPLYRVFADYTSRLSVLLTGGRHVCPVALLYLGNSAHAGKHVTPEQMSEALQDALLDCDWIPYDVFEGSMRIEGRTLRLRDEAYRVLVVPPVETIPYPTLAKVKAFYDAGGIVVAHGFLPTRSATLGRTSADIARLREAVWGSPSPGLTACRTNDAGGRAYLLPQVPSVEDIERAIVSDAGVRPSLEVVDGATDHWLHVLHRVKDGRDIFFVTNQNHVGAARRFTFRVTAPGVPECWDAMRNERTSIAYRREGDHVLLDLTLEPNESVLLVFQPTDRRLPPRVADGGRSLRAAAEVVRDPAPPVAAPPPSDARGPADLLTSCSWVWYPEGDPRTAAPVGVRAFRKKISLPTGVALRKATFVGTADNGFELFVDGARAGGGDESGEGWRNPVELDITAMLHPGAHTLAIAATNGGDQPNPAGLIGRLLVTLSDGSTIDTMVDDTWKTSDHLVEGWTGASFDDSSWPNARAIARFGDAPWGRLEGQITLAPAKADPFVGHARIDPDWLRPGARVFLVVEDLKPEEAARVTVNGADAGGFIGRPLRLDITRLVKAGVNTLRLDPFSPSAARLEVYR